ncbi:enoyl-CoA hydratase/isomerase family protein [Streptomyces sp. NBC_01803]|uniref:enoyl-CoA hydratase/isomerase family protein n=1 Tax=Streptomyces sp. NBC_01803 TaxID=2975946 RepID=UPI002DD9AEEB|nr:enoyl-CoA hydratase/isomerase family protein [Streptomyces sp. NBC_01803]WSA43280.1 enoyl-CoA hydratase/isomerase family protein [Streptomyces sp. NBC_01803]
MFDNIKPLLDVRRDDHVLHVRLNTPENGNIVTEPLLDELISVLAAVRTEPGIRVLTLSGAGDDFCLGADRHEFDRLIAEDPSGALIQNLGVKARQVCDGLAMSSVVTIARVHGRVIGAGVAFAIFCDLRVGADDCRFRMPELALGLPVAWGGALPRLVHEVGAARIRELILTGDSFDAETARELTVLHRTAPPDEVDAVVAGWIRPLVRRAPGALRTTKAALNAHAGASRFADATLLEGDLLASVLAARHYARGVVP